MEMKNAPLVHETTSKVKSLRKVAITVAVVALTVCGVAVGMVAAGMENKSVPTLKYTVGTKTTYNGSYRIQQKSGGQGFNSEVAVEQFVLSVDAAGATTFLVAVPVVADANEVGAVDAADEEAVVEEAIPMAAFVVTQAADGTVDWESVKTDMESGTDAFESAAKMLIQHMEFLTPRLAADASISETDAFMGRTVDAKYTVNNLEEGTSEVVRTVSPAGVTSQVNGPQLGASANSVITIKDGEVVAAKSTKANEISTIFEKAGSNDGTVGVYKDSRDTAQVTMSMTKGATETFDLAAFAKDLLKFQACDVAQFGAEVEVQTPHVVNNGFTSESFIGSGADDVVVEEEAERSLLNTWSTTKGKWIGKFDIAIGGTEDCGTKTSDSSKERCSNKMGFTVTLTILHTSVFTKKVGLSASLFLGKKYGDGAPKNTITMTFKLIVVMSNSYTFNVQIYAHELGTGQTRANKIGAECNTPSIPVPYATILGYGLYLRGGFNVGFDWNGTLNLRITKGSGKWGCIKNPLQTAGTPRSRRYQNTGNACNTNSTTCKYGNLPYFSKWYHSGSAGLMGMNSTTKYYIKLNTAFYKKAGCTRAYGSGKTRMKASVSLTPFFSAWAEILIQTGCLFRAKRIRFGVRVTGRLFSFTYKFVVFLVNAAKNCALMTFAINGMTFTVAPFFQYDYKYNCRKTKWLFASILASVTISWTTAQSFAVHLPLSTYNWFIYPCASTAAEACNSLSSTATFEKTVFWNAACKHDTYLLEHHTAGANKWNVTW